MKIETIIENLGNNLKPVSVRQQRWCEEHHLAVRLAESSKAQGKFKCMYSLHTYSGDWHIVRNYMSYLEMWNHRTEYFFTRFCEVSQWFYNVKTNRIYMRMRPGNYRGEILCQNKMRVRRQFDNYYTQMMYRGEGLTMLGSRLHPLLRRNGLSIDKMHMADNDLNLRWYIYDVIERIMKEPVYETLMKSQLWRLVGLDIKRKAELHLLIRNHIMLTQEEVTEWTDALNMMEEEHIDFHNGRIMKEWRKYHERCIKMRNRRGELTESKNIAEANGTFLETHKDWLGIKWQQYGMTFASLNSVLEYYQEGQAMHHCVYQCQYYRKQDTIILSIRDAEGKRLATAEYNLEQEEVVQIRSSCNGFPARYNDMLKSISEYMLNLKREKNGGRCKELQCG